MPPVRSRPPDGKPVNCPKRPIPSGWLKIGERWHEVDACGRHSAQLRNRRQMSRGSTISQAEMAVSEHVHPVRSLRKLVSLIHQIGMKRTIRVVFATLATAVHSVCIRRRPATIGC